MATSKVKEERRPGLSLASMPPDAKRRLSLIVGGGVMVLALLILLPDRPQSASGRADGKAAAKIAEPLALAPPKTRPLKEYSSLMGRNLFQPLVSDRVRRPAPSASNATGFTPPSGVDPLPPLTLRDAQGLSRPNASLSMGGWEYIGSVTVDNVPFALMLNTKTGDTGYYRAGEAFGNGVIRAIGMNDLVLSAPGGETLRIPKTSGALAAPAPAAAPARSSNRTSRGPAPQPNANENSEPEASEASSSSEDSQDGPSDDEREERRRQFMERRQMFRQNRQENSGGAGNGRGERPRRQRERPAPSLEQGVALATPEP